MDAHQTILARVRKDVLVSFDNETSSNLYAHFLKGNAGIFAPNRILINRKDITKPDHELMDEAITILHEHGHWLSYQRGTKYLTSETGFSYQVKSVEQKTRVLLEECNAWKYAFITMMHLPFSFPYKLYMGALMLFVSFEALLAAAWRLAEQTWAQRKAKR